MLVAPDAADRLAPLRAALGHLEGRAGLTFGSSAWDGRHSLVVWQRHHLRGHGSPANDDVEHGTRGRDFGRNVGHGDGLGPGDK